MGSRIGIENEPRKSRNSVGMFGTVLRTGLQLVSHSTSWVGYCRRIIRQRGLADTSSDATLVGKVEFVSVHPSDAAGVQAVLQVGLSSITNELCVQVASAFLPDWQRAVGLRAESLFDRPRDFVSLVLWKPVKLDKSRGESIGHGGGSRTRSDSPMKVVNK